VGDTGKQRRFIEERVIQVTGNKEKGQPEADQEKLMKRAKNTAYRYLTIRPRSRKELADKLQDKEFTGTMITAVLEHVTRLGYLDDEKFAAQWAASRVRSRGFGRRRLEQELRIKGISSNIIKDTLNTLFEEAPEAETARKEADKKLRTLTRFEPEVRRRRLAGFLERKGFSSEIIRGILHVVR
jgi:regulatory protein